MFAGVKRKLILRPGRIFIQKLLRIIFSAIYDFRVEGEEKLPLVGPAIIACNHESYLDGPIVISILNRWGRFICDWIYFRLPLLKQAGGFLEVIPIAPRKINPEVLERAYEIISKVLRSGGTIVIFPEGWITRDGKPREFLRGIEKIVERDPVPVIPVSISGMWGSLLSFERGRVLLKFPRRFRPKVIVRIGDPVPPEDVKAEKLRELIIEMKGKN